MITLYRRHQTGRIGTWEIWNEGNVIRMVTRTNAEAQPVYHTEVVPAGKAGRTLEQQIESRILSRVRAKLDNGYKETYEKAMTDANTNAAGLPRPMLASSNSSKLLARATEVYVQPKLDGMRMIVTMRDGKILAYTRQGKPITTVGHILRPLARVLEEDVYLDGELYAHDQSLQQIMSWAKRQQPDSEQLLFHVFDHINNDAFRDRWAYLSDWYLDSPSIHDTTVLVPTDNAQDVDIQTAFNCVRQEGYEGLILRDGTCRYEPGKRVQHLAKLKAFQEQEYLCTDLTKGAQGEPVLVCSTVAGKTFRVTAPGTHAHRREAAMYVGARVTIKHAGITPYGIPFHPVCLGVK
jgi:ATP-dependent DNA ligase